MDWQWYMYNTVLYENACSGSTSAYLHAWRDRVELDVEEASDEVVCARDTTSLSLL